WATTGPSRSGDRRSDRRHSAGDRYAPVVEHPTHVRNVLDALHVLLRPGYLRRVDDVDREGVVNDEVLDLGPDGLELGTAGRQRLEFLRQVVEGGVAIAARVADVAGDVLGGDLVDTGQAFRVESQLGLLQRVEVRHVVRALDDRELDADLLPLLLEHRGQLIVLGFGQGHDAGREAMRVAGLGQEGLGLLRVVGVDIGQRLVIEGRRGREDAPRWLALAIEEGVVDGLSVRGEVQRLTDLELGQRPRGRTDRDEEVAGVG